MLSGGGTTNGFLVWGIFLLNVVDPICGMVKFAVGFDSLMVLGRLGFVLLLALGLPNNLFSSPMFAPRASLL
jgi:hypothetical protein